MTLRPKNQNIPTIGAEKNTQIKRKKTNRQTDGRYFIAPSLRGSKNKQINKYIEIQINKHK